MRTPRVTAVALLTTASAALLVPPTPPVFSLRTATPVYQRAAVLCSVEDDAQKLEVGSGIMCRDEESMAWWRATVSDTRDNEVLVHFTGCDSAWDQWFDADSPDIMLMDATEKATDANAFQSEAYEATLDQLGQEELLEQYRQERWDDNARWQLTTFGLAQIGEWSGEIELYELDEKGSGVTKRVGPWTPDCTCVMSYVEDASLDDKMTTAVDFADTLPSVAAQYQVAARMGASSFRPEKGNMAVASAFTLAQPVSADEPAKGWLFEVSIGEADRRVRCKLLYAADAAAASDGAMRLEGLAVVREARGGQAFLSADVNIDGRPGAGLYDPPPGEKTGYCSLYCAGGITLVFPTSVGAGQKGTISLDWIAGEMRYQCDRKFNELDGSLSSLELTEIQKSDAERFLPDFPHQGGGSTA